MLLGKERARAREREGERKNEKALCYTSNDCSPSSKNLICINTIGFNLMKKLTRKVNFIVGNDHPNEKHRTKRKR